MSREALCLLQKGDKMYCFACSQYAPVLVKVCWRRGRSLGSKGKWWNWADAVWSTGKRCDLVLHKKINVEAFCLKCFPVSESSISLKCLRFHSLVFSGKSKMWIKMNVQHWWNGTERTILKYCEKNLSQCHFVHHDLKSNLDLRCKVPKTVSATVSSIVLSILCNKYIKSELIPHREYHV